MPWNHQRIESMLGGAKVVGCAGCLIVAGVFSPDAGGAVVFSEGFEGLTAGGAWAGQTGWAPLGPDGDIVDSPVFAGSGAGRLNNNPFGAEAVGIVFNQDGSLGLADGSTFWFEWFDNQDWGGAGGFYGIRFPRTNDPNPGDVGGQSRLQIGYFSNDDASGHIFASGAALANQHGDYVSQDGSWNHHVAEVSLNGASSTLRVYAKQKSAGDTSPLTPADIVNWGAAGDTLTFSWTGLAGDWIDEIDIFNGLNASNNVFDNIAIYDTNPIVPEPGTLALTALAFGASMTRRRR